MNNISRTRWPVSLGFSIFITQFVAILHIFGTSEWMCLSLEHSALKCRIKVAIMAPRPILVFSATTSRLFQSDLLVFSCSSGATNKGFRKFSWGLFHVMERGVSLYRPHVITREKIWVVLISAGSGCVGTNQGFGKLRWVWTKCGKLNQGQP